jgi:hypothetical protein
LQKSKPQQEDSQQKRELTFSQQKVNEFLCEPILEQVKSMFEHFERHKEQYDELMAELDFKDLFIHDVLMEKTWGEDGIPAQKKIPYDIHVRDVQNSYLDAFADNYIRSTTETCDMDAYIKELVSIYNEALGGADGILERNTELINDFFERVQFWYGRLKDTTILEEKIKKKKADNVASKKIVEEEIEEITTIEIEKLKTKIKNFEDLKSLAPDGKPKPKEPKVEATDEHGKIGIFLKEMVGSSWNLLSEFLSVQAKKPMFWVTIMLFFVSMSCYYNILKDQIPDMGMFFLFLGFLCVANAILPIYVAKHIIEKSKLKIVLGSCISAALAGFVILLSYDSMQRFEFGNKLVMSLGVAVIPLIFGLMLGFAWKSEFQKGAKAA